MSAKVDVEKFDGKGDFNLWRKKIRAILVQQKVFKVLEDPKKLPTPLTTEQKYEMSEIAFSTIILHLSDKVLRQVEGEDNVAGLWLKLEKLFMTKSLTNKIFLKDQLYTYKMDTTKDLDDNLDDFNRIVSDLTHTGETFADEDQAIILLNALPENYKDVKSAMMYGRETLELDQVLAALKIKEKELKVNKKNGDMLLVQRGRSEQKKSQQNNKNRRRSKSRNKNKGVCFNCNKPGHFKANCPTWKGKDAKSENKKEQGPTVNLTDGYESSEVLLVTDRDTDSEWILDSGCSFHMTPNKSYFKTFEPIKGGNVKVGNGQICSIEGIGSIKLLSDDGVSKILNSVRYVPTLNRNLISLGMLDAAGYTYKSGGGDLKIYKGSLLKLRGRLIHGLYVLQGISVEEHSALSVENASKTAVLWHKRLAHVSEKGLNLLEKQGAFGKQKLGDLPFCEECVLGKSTRVSFAKGIHCTKGILEYIHSDLWGPSRVPTSGGGRYYLLLVDGFSRRIWTFILKTKDEAFPHSCELTTVWSL